jgi:putative ABC transport system permease protein
MASGLLGCFSFLALALAAIGLYAVVAYWTGQRKREIAVRMALGAHPRDVLRLVLMRGAQLASAGAVVGLLISLAVTRTVSEILFGSGEFDVTATALITALLAATVLLASYVPARRAMRLDPMVALRHE